MSTGIVLPSALLALLLLMPAMFAQLDESIARYARFLTPTARMLQLIGSPAERLRIPVPVLLVLLAWMILVTAAFALNLTRTKTQRLD